MAATAAEPFVLSFEVITTYGGYFVAIILLLWFLYFIYNRAGSLFFLRDLIWRSFGGKQNFDNPTLEQIRRELRELEHFRYEFNIPANSLSDAEHAHLWITTHGFRPADIGRSRNYIDWSDFTTLKFKHRRFDRKKFAALYTILCICFVGVMITPPFTDTDYLMVSLKDAPEAPSFFVSKNDIKFDYFSPDDFLTVEKCRSSQTLKPFIREGLPEEKLDIICSLFIDSNYAVYVENGLREQRGFIIGLLLMCFAAMILIVRKLSRMDRARELHLHLQQTQP
ncbi:DUF6216 family protein [Pseudomonas sp. NPDC089554]|uniref:DUF6216 family protein n=1 Tax=Pseudomonas sp. NPDC089554 TaxID=3390653 RepID=UPI003D08FFF5